MVFLIKRPGVRLCAVDTPCTVTPDVIYDARFNIVLMSWNSKSYNFHRCVSNTNCRIVCTAYRAASYVRNHVVGVCHKNNKKQRAFGLFSEPGLNRNCIRPGSTGLKTNMNPQ